MDTGGTLRLYYTPSSSQIALSLGSMTTYNETFMKQVTVTPLLSLPAERAFPLETSNSRQYNFAYTRVHPEDYDDSSTDPTRWSNAYWYLMMTNAINRWQAKTDGFRLVYTPDADNPYVPALNVNGYIKSFTRYYRADESNTTISGNLTFYVGTMYVNAGSSVPIPTNASSTLLPAPVPKNDFVLMMSDVSGNSWYILLDEDTDNPVDCVKSYTLSGGMAQPFEVLNIKIPKKRLTTVAPALVDGIEAGKNKVILKAVGTSNMTVTKCKLSDGVYTVTAYCNAEILKGYTLSETSTALPYNWIRRILTSGEFGVTFNEGTTFLTTLTDPPTSGTDYLTFATGTSAWYVLQVCAIYLGCKIFFTDNKAYLTDFRLTSGISYTSGTPPMFNYGTVSLYSDSAMDGRVTGSVYLGDEGTDTIVNAQTVMCSDTPDVVASNKTYEQMDSESVQRYGKRAGSTLYTPELAQGEGYSQASTFLANFLSYRSEPQQSISFTVKEMYRSGGTIRWRPCFATSSRIVSIVDEADDVVIDNGGVPQRLLLSSFERSYPEGQTTYDFGIVSNIDLSTSTSQIMGNLSNVR